MRTQLHLPNILGFLVLLFIVMTFSSCELTNKITNTSNAPLKEEEKIIEMTKGPCYGRCPVFTISIYDNKMAAYRGKQFTERKGLWVKKLEKEEYNKLTTAFKNANLWQFNDMYKGQVPDLQTVTIAYTEGERSKSVKGKDGRPETILNLEEMLDNLANSTGWELKEKPESGLPENVIADELIVQLNGGVDPHKWAQKYAKQGMKVVKSLSPNGYYWLVKYDSEVVPPESMLEMVRGDSNVLAAEYNKKLDGRN